MASLAFLSAPAFAGPCPDFSGTYKGLISNSNYGHTVKITQTGCAKIAVEESGVDGNDSAYEQNLTGATATVDSTLGVVRTVSGYWDFTSLYLTSSEVNVKNPAWPSTSLEVFSKNAKGKLTISKLQGTAQFNELISFEEQ